jgi:2',3'-cyclic-nucleotide 2'-phosphodiesterase/3'-nucleotidase
MAATGIASCAAVGCAAQDGQASQKVPDVTVADASGTRRLRILATSDMHGVFVPWDYALDEKITAGSVAQVATAVKELRDEDTLLVDAGDTIQDNMAELFAQDEIHPMIACMNSIGYDIGVTGNHDYDYGMDVVRKTVASFEGKVLVGNVIDENGDPVAEGSTIIDKNGVRVGLVGMVTPNIVRWDEKQLRGCTVSNPMQEARKLIDQIKDDVDVLVGVMHMGLASEFGEKGSGVRDIAEACPEFDLIVAAHSHQLIEGEDVNGVLVVENKYHAQTMSVVDLMLEADGDGWKVVDRTSSSVQIADYEPDTDLMDAMASFDKKAKDYAHEEIAVLTGGSLAPANEIAEIPQAMIQDTALLDLVNTVQLHYSGARVAAAALFNSRANVEPGPIRRCDVSKIYKFDNTLYTVEMTGAQLRKQMEWAAGVFQQYHEGDLTIGFSQKRAYYLCDSFQGVNYKVNIAKEEGSRIEDLTWPDGTPVADDESFVFATNNFRATTALLAPGMTFDEGEELPKLLEIDVAGSIGGIRDMLVDYIVNVMGGEIEPATDNNWSIVGNDWDPAEHQQAVELIAAGKLSVATNEQKFLTGTVITREDVQRALES